MGWGGDGGRSHQGSQQPSYDLVLGPGDWPTLPFTRSTNMISALLHRAQHKPILEMAATWDASDWFKPRSDEFKLKLETLRFWVGGPICLNCPKSKMHDATFIGQMFVMDPTT